MTDVLSILHDYLKAHPSLSDLKDWNKANGFISLKDSGLSLGIENEQYEDENRDYDKCTTKVNIFVWIKNKDQAIGEQKVRELAHAVRLILNQDDVRTLNGEAIGGFVKHIQYLTTEAQHSLLLHIAEITYEVEYEEYRLFTEEVSTVQTVNNESEIEE